MSFVQHYCCSLHFQQPAAPGRKWRATQAGQSCGIPSLHLSRHGYYLGSNPISCFHTATLQGLCVSRPTTTTRRPRGKDSITNTTHGHGHEHRQCDRSTALSSRKTSSHEGRPSRLREAMTSQSAAPGGRGLALLDCPAKARGLWYRYSAASGLRRSCLLRTLQYLPKVPCCLLLGKKRDRFPGRAGHGRRGDHFGPS